MNYSKAMLLTVCAGLVAAPTSDSLRAEEAADLFECGECHVMRIRDFKGRRANPIVAVEEYPDEPTGTQDIASTSGMCLSCHDGFVEDSRLIWKDGHSGHPVGMQPSARVVQPELGGALEFPLNEGGNLYCGTCHSARAATCIAVPATPPI